jgi:hypothetical protein
MRNEKHKNHPEEATRAEVTKEMNKPRMTASARKTLELSAAAIRPFHANECVYNRETKEHGLIRDAYEKNGVIMYEVRIPASPDSLKRRFFVSDRAEGVLEPSDKILERW